MDRQAIYDRVRKHLLGMTAPAVSGSPGEIMGDFRCLYLAPDGARCAIGCLIPDGHEAQEYNGDVTDLVEAYGDLADLWGVTHHTDLEFLTRLQNVHDDIRDNWGPGGLNADGRMALDVIALAEGLTIEPGGWFA